MTYILDIIKEKLHGFGFSYNLKIEKHIEKY